MAIKKPDTSQRAANQSARKLKNQIYERIFFIHSHSDGLTKWFRFAVVSSQSSLWGESTAKAHFHNEHVLRLPNFLFTIYAHTLTPIQIRQRQWRRPRKGKNDFMLPLPTPEKPLFFSVAQRFDSAWLRIVFAARWSSLTMWWSPLFRNASSPLIVSVRFAARVWHKTSGRRKGESEKKSCELNI